MGLQEDLDLVAARQGKVIPKGNHISGFGPNDPPAGVPIVESARERYGEPVEFQAEQDGEAPAYDDPLVPMAEAELTPPPSPLIPLRDRRVQPRETLPSSDPFAGVKLVVMDGYGVYQGRAVVLTEKEQAEAGRVVLRAIERTIKEQLAEVQGKLPKRRRASRAAPRSAIAAPPESEAKPKRGRPRKVRP